MGRIASCRFVFKALLTNFKIFSFFFGLQMNMGEGKTAVIIPLVALSLADGKRLCRITVLRSLYQINLKSLSLKIGGLLLNRRVYTMPCRRDYPIEAGNINKMVNAYQECFDEKGVFLTLAEHRLSFELKKHEKALAESYSDSTAINEVLNWLQSNARDVLDESDEILQVTMTTIIESHRNNCNLIYR